MFIKPKASIRKTVFMLSIILFFREKDDIVQTKIPAEKKRIPAKRILAATSSECILNSEIPSFISGNANAHAKAHEKANADFLKFCIFVSNFSPLKNYNILEK